MEWQGRVDTKALSAPWNGNLPLEDPAMLAAGDAPVAFLTNLTNITNA
jgi:hypothetical protein